MPFSGPILILSIPSEIGHHYPESCIDQSCAIFHSFVTYIYITI